MIFFKKNRSKKSVKISQNLRFFKKYNKKCLTANLKKIKEIIKKKSKINSKKLLKINFKAI